MDEHPARETRAHKRRFFSKEELHAVFLRGDDPEPETPSDQRAVEASEDPEPLF